MRRGAYWLCAVLALAIAAWVLFRYGVAPLSLLVALLLLSCPVFVIWLTLRQARQTGRDIEAATRQELARRSHSKPGDKP